MYLVNMYNSLIAVLGAENDTAVILSKLTVGWSLQTSSK